MDCCGVFSKMELHTSPEQKGSEKKGPNYGSETAFREVTTVGGTGYGAFQSKDPIVSVEKANPEKGGDDGHGITVSHPTSYIETLMHLFKGNVGAGMLALGDAYKNAGLLLSPPLILFLGVICVHAQHILLSCSEEMARRLQDESGRCPGFARTVELCFATGPIGVRKYSKLMRKLVNLFLCITQLGFCSVYFVFISTNIKQVLDNYGIVIDVHVHMIIVLAPILLSTWIRNLKYLTPISSLANFLMVAGFACTMYIMSVDLPPIQERNYVASWSTLPLFFGTVVYSFEAISLVLPLKNEMQKPRDFDKPAGVLNVGMILVSGMFVSIGFLAYLKYGDDVQGSVTLNLDATQILPQVIKVAISLGILFSFAIQFYVPVVIIWPTVSEKLGPFRWPTFAEIVFRSVLCILTFTLAEAIPKLNLFISLVGAVSSTALALLFPPIIEMVVCWQNSTINYVTFAKDIFIILVGILGFLTGTYEGINSLVKAFSE